MSEITESVREEDEEASATKVQTAKQHFSELLAQLEPEEAANRKLEGKR